MFRPWLRPLAAVAMALGLCAGVARADHLDDKLNANAPRIVEALQKQGVKNVGVLRFRVKDGDRPETFSAGPLNGNLAVRLENILVLHAGTEDKDALGIIHNAAQEAGRHKVGKWQGNEAEQRKLFAIDTYPLAWGSKKVKADAFVTGLVKLSSDCKRGTVVVEALTAPGEVKKLVEFSFEGDPALLMDLGKSYSLSRRSLAGARTPLKTRDLVFEAARRGDDSPNGNPPPAGNNPPSGNDQPVVNNAKDTIEVGGVEFQLLSDGQAVTFKPKDASNNNGGYQLESPEVNKQIVFKITNKTDKTVGVDVKFNGSSLYLEQTDEPANCRVWVLKPEDKYRSYSLKGWYLQDGDGEKLKLAPFKVLTGDDAQKWRDSLTQLADKAGTICVTVFEEGDPAGSEMLISARGLKKGEDAFARSDLGRLQRSLMKSGHLMRDVKKRELIVPDKDSLQAVADNVIKSIDFQRKPVAIGSAIINVVPRAVAPTNGSNNGPN